MLTTRCSTPGGMRRAVASWKVSRAQGGQGLRHAESPRAVRYPPGIQAHPGGQRFPSRPWRAGVQAAQKSAQTASRNVRLPRGTPWYLQNRTQRLSLLPPLPRQLQHTTSGGATLKCPRPTTSALLATGGEQKLGTNASSFRCSRSF